MMEVLILVCGCALGAAAGWWLCGRTLRNAALQTEDVGKDAQWEVENENARLQSQVDQLHGSLLQAQASMQDAIGQWEQEQRLIEHSAGQQTQAVVRGAMGHSQTLAKALADLRGISKTF